MKLTPTEISHVATVISQEMGLHYPPNRYEELLNGIRKAAHALEGRFTMDAIIEQIQSGKGIHPEIFKELSVALTVNETYFFREKTAIKFIQNLIIPEIINSDNRYNIWSAGCSSGEEPYTLAILLKEHLPPNKFKNITIKATDISTKALEKAKEGKYTDWSFRETPPTVQEKYFHKKDKLWQISNEIREKVEFSILNLAKESYPSNMRNQYDVVLCRNVIIYFSNETSKKIANNLYETLKENGWLITSQVELNDQIFEKFSKVHEDNGFFYRKHTIQQSLTHSANTSTVKHETPHKQGIINKLREQLIRHKTQIKKELQDNSTCKEPDPKNNQSHNNLYNKAIELASKRQYKESMRILELLMSQDQFKADFFYLYGAILLELNEKERAAEYFKKCLYLNPRHLLSEYMLGMIYRQEGKHTLSQKYLKRAYNNASREDPQKIVDNSEGLTAGHIAEELKNFMQI